jgi:hypothetical protein
MKSIHNPAACITPAILGSKMASIEGSGSLGGGTSHDCSVGEGIKRHIARIYFIISTFAFLYTMV